MSGLGEQIAVLDGLAALDPSDGRLGQTRARVDQYARRVMPGVLARNNVLDASGGANYSGGSSYAEGLPLMPSTVGLAGYGFGSMPGVLPNKLNVIDPSGGANYTGGDAYSPGIPLMVSSAGLAAALIEGGYGRAGLGAPLIDGGYGRAGLGGTMSAADEDLAGAAEAVAVARQLDSSDGRLGQARARVDQYGRPVMPGVLMRNDVLDASEGANYSGGSTYPDNNPLPLLPSSAGLAGLDGLADGALGLTAPARKVMGNGAVAKLKGQINKLAAAIKSNPPPQQKMRLVAALRAQMNLLSKIRMARMTAAQRKAAGALARKRAAASPGLWEGASGQNVISPFDGFNDYAQRIPMWAR